MKKTNFFKLLTVGVLSAALFATSCNYVKEADFQDLCKRVDATETGIGELKTQLAAMDYVKSVVAGPGAGEWTVTPNKGTALTISTLTEAQVKAWIDESKAGDPDPTGLVSVKDGQWYIGDTAVSVKANEMMPRLNTSKTPNYWEFPVLVGKDFAWTPIPGATVEAAVEGITQEQLDGEVEDLEAALDELRAELEAVNTALTAAIEKAVADAGAANAANAADILANAAADALVAARVKALEDKYGVEIPALAERLDALEAEKLAYAVYNETAEQWSLYMPDGEGGELTEVQLPSKKGLAYASVAKIDILGWVDDYTPDMGLATDAFDARTSDRTQYRGYDALDPDPTGLWNAPETTFVVYYTWIEKFFTDRNPATQINGNTSIQPPLGPIAVGDDTGDYGDYLTGTAAAGLIAGDPRNTTYTYPGIYTPDQPKPTGYNWGGAVPTYTDLENQGQTYGAKAVNRYALNTFLDRWNKGLVIQVHPLTADIKDVDFILQDSKGQTMPINFKKPVKITGLKTRAEGSANGSALWFIEGVDPARGTYTDAGSRHAFVDKFTDDTVWSLVTADGLRSEYTQFTFTPSFVRSRENQMVTLLYAKDNTEVAEPVEVQYPSTSLTPSKAWPIELGDFVTATFEDVVFRKANGDVYDTDIEQLDHEISYGGDEKAPFESAYPRNNGWDINGNTTNEIVDWYWEVGSNHKDDKFIRKSWGIEFSADRHQFRSTKRPDEITGVAFWMDLYKLGVDGTIYVERVPFIVTQTIPDSEIEVPYTIYDQWPAYNNDYMSTTIKYEGGDIPLQPMFTNLGAVKIGSTSQDSSIQTMEDRWKDNDHGAFFYTFSNLAIEGLSGNQLSRFMFPQYVEKSMAGSGTGTQTGTTNTTGVKAETGTVYTDAAALSTFPGTPPVIGQDANNFGAEAMGIQWLDGAGEVTNFLYEARAIRLTPNYAYNNGVSNQPSFERGKKHTFTVDFYNVDNEFLSSYDIIITPDIPMVDLAFNQDRYRWAPDAPADPEILQAYYATPFVPNSLKWAEHKFYGKDYYNLYQFHDGAAIDWAKIGSVAKHEAGAGMTGWHVAESSTYYNVLNPGLQNGMQHTNTQPLDGGYLSVTPGTNNEGRAWVDAASVDLRTEGEAAYGDDLRFPESDKVNRNNPTVGNYTPVPTTPSGRDFAWNTVVQLLDQTNKYPDGAATDETLQKPDYTGIPFTALDAPGDGYNDVLPLYWNINNYIHFYKYTKPEMETKYPFSMRIMSALEKGEIEGGELVVNQGTRELEISDANIWAWDYDRAHNRRSIFKEYNASYPGLGYFAYPYIAKVIFYRPEGITIYDIKGEENQQDNSPREAVAPTADKASYLPIRTNNTEFGGVVPIGVKIYDRFGRTLEKEVDIKVTYRPAN